VQRNRQDWQAVELYRLLFSHPAIEAITWWDLSDLNSWMGAPAGVLRKDMSPKPAYNKLKNLIKKEWWTGPLELKTDKSGSVGFRAFLGEYSLECQNGKAEISIAEAGQVKKSVNLTYASYGGRGDSPVFDRK